MSQLTFRDLWEKCRDHLRYAQRIWWAFPCPSDCSKQHDNVAPGLATSGGLGWPVVAGVSRAGASGLAEAGGLAILLGAGWFGAVVLGARLVGVLSHQAITAPAAGGRSAVKMGLWLPLGWLLLAALVAPAGVKPEVMMARSLRGLSLASVGVGSFALGSLVFSPTQGLPGHLCFLANGAATIAVAAAMAFARNESYSQVVKRDYLVGANGPPGSGDRLLWCLGPALVATGVQMFQYRARIVALSKVLFLSCAVVSLSNIVGTVVMGPLLGISPEVTLAATMRCVTIPMALPTYARLCEESGAENNVALVALCAGLSGFIGFGFSQRLLSSAACHAHLDPVARGIATGAAAHALGAACLVAAEPEAFVWGMLAMAVSGVASSAWICACAPLRETLLSLAYRRAEHGG
ncbi:Plastidal glycolate/glycerate translocator 1 [Durusdinium trenchii]|uniref:Chloroplastic (Bacterial membrane protein LrgB-like protein) (AtLrgB) n=1 Tax=Durusdinium trenchii TaxID=1381693 RepID=A0ABP0S9X3_9DINO